MNNLINAILILFPITTLVQGISVFSGINQILIGILGFLLLVRTNLRFSTEKFNIILVAGSVWLFSLIMIDRNYFRVNDVFYFLFSILFYIYLQDNIFSLYDFMKLNQKYIKTIFIVFCFLIGISILFKSSYIYSWGGARYFKSFADNTFRLSSVCLLFLSILFVFIRITNHKRYFLFIIVPLCCAFFTGSRIYFGLISFFIICMFYIVVKKKLVFFITTILLCIIMMIFFPYTPLANKVAYVSYSGRTNINEILAIITSGRSIFWAIDLREFFKLSVIQQFFGNGLTFSFKTNIELYGRNIWAHNDYIDLLMCYGYIGLALYLYTFFGFIEKNRVKIANYKFGHLLCFLCLISSNAFFNGVYTYIAATIAVPFMWLTFFGIYMENNHEKTNTNLTN